MKSQQFQGTIEIVVDANRPGIRLCPTGGSPCPFFEGTRLEPLFHEVFGHDEHKTTHLGGHALALLLLLLLARATPHSIQALDYAPTPDGKLYLHEVGRLHQWSKYHDAAKDPTVLERLGRDRSNYFPTKQGGPVRVSREKPRQIWIELDASAIHFASGATRAALDYIQGIASPSAAAAQGSQSSKASIHVDELPGAGQELFGREGELAVLDGAWQCPDDHVVLVVGWGGVGKSALVRHWCNRLGLARANIAFYGWSFYRQGTQGDGASSDLFFERALGTFGDAEPVRGDPRERAERLAGLLRRQPTLLVLDGVEPLQDPHENGRLRDPGLQSLLRHLAGRMNGLVVVTTRPPFGELLDCVDRGVRRIELDALSVDAGVELLRSCGARGIEKEMKIACREVHGHALTLTLLGTYLADAWKGDIRRRSNMAFPVIEGEGSRHAQRVILAYDAWYDSRPEQAVLRLLGLFDRPAPLAAIRALRGEPAIAGVTAPLAGLREADWNRCLTALRRARLLGEDDGSETLDVHPLVRACFGDALRRDNPAGFRAAHGRLFEHFRTSGKPLPDEMNDRLAEIEPLLLAVHHGCQAARWPEALELYRARVRRGDRHFTVYELNAIGADLAVLAGFFDDAGRLMSALPTAEHGWLFLALGIATRALGRTEDALRAFSEAALAHERERQWIAAALATGNAGDIHIRRGDLSRAREIAGRESDLAARSGDPFVQGLVAGHKANLHHLLGELKQAGDAFAEGRGLVAGARASSGLLAFYEDIFFFQWYWDFVLDTEPGRASEALLDRPKHAEEWPFGLIFQRMIHARAQLILGNTHSARALFDEATGRLRDTGEQTWLPTCLLNRGWLLLEDDLAGASNDVEEALAIAVSAGLRSAQCDGRVLQARVAAAKGDIESAGCARDAARALLKETGYMVRAPDVELLDVRLAAMQGDVETARDQLARVRSRIQELGYGSREAEVRTLEVMTGHLEV